MPDYDPVYRARIQSELAAARRRDRRDARLAYLLIVAAAGLGFYAIGQQQADLCHGATENRVALRSLVGGVADLGESLILGPDVKPGDYVSPEQQTALDRVTSFEDRQLKALELPVCE